MNILVVDDSIFVRQFMKKYLIELKPNIEINYAASGEEGYQVYLEKLPSLIITDLLMPGMGGQAFIEALRKIDSATKVIVLSADIQKSVKDEIIALGISAFLNKPITRENIRTIADLIDD
jgi:two-component system chemotaxis response regulator CheY